MQAHYVVSFVVLYVLLISSIVHILLMHSSKFVFLNNCKKELFIIITSITTTWLILYHSTHL